MHRDQSGDAALRYAVAGLADQLLLAVFRLVGDLVGLGEGRAQMMRRAHLQRLAVGHDHVNGRGVVRSGELVPAGPPAHQEGDGQAPVELRVPLNGHLHLLCRLFPGGMSSVSLLEGGDLPQADQGPGVLCLVAEGVDDLVDPQRQIGMRPDPELEHGIDGRLAGGPQAPA